MSGAAKICCPKCKGAGTIRMPAHMLATLRTLNKLGGTASTMELLAKVDLPDATAPHQALINRLTKLAGLDMLVREAINGRSFRWTLTVRGQAELRR